MKRLTLALVAASLGAVLIWLLAFGFGKDPSAIASPLLNKPAPAFTLHTLDGRRLSLASLHGTPVILNFWASWCPSCKDEHTALLAAWQRYRGRVAFVGVGFSDTAPDLRAFMRQYGGTWPILQDPGQQTAINYGVAGPPETFFIDRQGVVRFKVTGPLSAGLLRRHIAQLLGGRS